MHRDLIQQFSERPVWSSIRELPVGYHSCPQAIAKIPNDPTGSGSHKPELQVRMQTTWVPGQALGLSPVGTWESHLISHQGFCFIWRMGINEKTPGEWTDTAAPIIFVTTKGEQPSPVTNLTTRTGRKPHNLRPPSHTGLLEVEGCKAMLSPMRYNDPKSLSSC